MRQLDTPSAVHLDHGCPPGLPGRDEAVAREQRPVVSSVFGRIQRLLSRNVGVVTVCLKLRNQCAAVIAHHLGESADLELDGEARLIRAAAPHCSTFADVGANRGEWADLFVRANPAASGLVFEPAPAALRFLRARFAANPNIEVIPMAAGDREGETTLYEQPDIGAESSLVARPTSDSQAVSARLTTLVAQLAQRGWSSLDFLKVDVEGYDFRVIQGSEALLSKQRIGIIQFEYSHMWPLAGNTLALALATLSGYGYQCFLLSSRGLQRVNYSRFGEYFSYSNYVAVAPDREDFIRPLLTKNGSPSA